MQKSSRHGDETATSQKLRHRMYSRLVVAFGGSSCISFISGKAIFSAEIAMPDNTIRYRLISLIDSQYQTDRSVRTRSLRPTLGPHVPCPNVGCKSRHHSAV